MRYVEVNFINCNFTKCFAIYDMYAISTNVTGCNFFNISTTTANPVIQSKYLANCSFKNISGTYITGHLISALRVFNCTVEDCKYPYIAGGTVSSSTSCYVEDSIFINCTGAAVIEARISTTTTPTTGRVYVNNCKFINNTNFAVFNNIISIFYK